MSELFDGPFQRVKDHFGQPLCLGDLVSWVPAVDLGDIYLGFIVSQDPDAKKWLGVMTGDGQRVAIPASRLKLEQRRVD